MPDPTTPDTLTAAAERAWTGRQLLAWLQQHPQWLDRPVELVEMAEDEDAPGARYLTLAESDQASDESWVISLCAWPEKSMEPPAPTPAVDREALVELGARAIQPAYGIATIKKATLVVDAFITAGYVTTRARVAERALTVEQIETAARELHRRDLGDVNAWMVESEHRRDIWRSKARTVAKAFGLSVAERAVEADHAG